MARKPGGTSRVLKTRERMFDERAFIDGVFNDEYILVVGSGVILNRDVFSNSGGDINQYIVDEINNDRRLVRTDFVEHKNFTDIYRATALDEIDPIYSLLTDGYIYDLDDMSPELLQLMRTKLFRFVLTTTIDGYLETLMRDIWGDDLRIVNISDNQSLNDFKDALANCRNNKYSEPTLFYAFGKVVNGRPVPRGYVETDVDAIKIIEKWMMDIDTKYVVPFIKTKRLLALGCKFDDWYFRFFWYILTRSFEDSDREGPKDIDGNLMTSDNLATMFDNSDLSDLKLKDYLLQRGVCMHEDVWEFMEHIYTSLTSISNDSLFYKMVLEKRKKGGIFISYKSCDVLTASEMFSRLSRVHGFNVWFDNVSLNGGDDYSNEIEEAIKQSKIFIPILSPQVAAELNNFDEDLSAFYVKEWQWASENKNLVVIPVAVNGYNLRADYNKIFEAIINRQSSGIDMSKGTSDCQNSERVGYSKLIESINNHLGLAE